MALRRVFTSRTEQQTQKIVIIGIDFGTSFTKVYFNQGGEVKQPIQFEVSGSKSYFLPTELYYNPTENKLYFHKDDNCEVLKYFKYSISNFQSVICCQKQYKKRIRIAKLLIQRESFKND